MKKYKEKIDKFESCPGKSVESKKVKQPVKFPLREGNQGNNLRDENQRFLKTSSLADIINSEI